MKKIGMIGLGNMGGGVCHRLVEAGYEVSVFDVCRESMEAFAGRAYLAADAAQVFARSEATFLSLPNSQIVEATLEDFFAQGVAGKTVVDLSTSNPNSTRMLYARMKEQGGALIDAPLSGSPADARAGAMAIVVAGDKEAVERMDAVFQSFTKSYEYVGPSGNAHLIKLAKNWASLVQALNYSQIYPVMEKLGIPAEQLYNIFHNPTLDNWVFRFYSKKFVNREYPVDFSLALGYKDICYMKQLCDSVGAPGYLLDGAMRLCEDALALGREQGVLPDMSYVGEQVHHALESAQKK